MFVVIKRDMFVYPPASNLAKTLQVIATKTESCVGVTSNLLTSFEANKESQEGTLLCVL